MIEQNFIQLYELQNWELPAITDYKGDNSYTYGELATRPRLTCSSESWVSKRAMPSR